MENFIIIAVLVMIVGAACRYMYKSKKSGRKCIGCPNEGSCPARNGAGTCGCASDAE